MARKDEVFQICKTLLLYSSVWLAKMPDWPKSSVKLYKVFSLLCQSLFVSCVPLFLVNLFKVIGHDMDTAVGVMKSLTFYGVVIAKIATIQSSKMTKLIESAIKKEETFIRSNDFHIRNLFRKYCLYSNMCALFVASFTSLTGIVLIIDSIYMASSYKIQYDSNVTDHFVYPHPVYMWFPFDKDSYYKCSLTYELIHIAQTTYYNGSAQAFIISALVLIKMQFKILQYRIKNLEPRRDNAINLLKKYAREHQVLIRWIGEFNDDIKYIILLEYCVSSLTFASILLDIIKGKQMAFNILFILLTISQIFAVAWSANEIFNEGSTGMSAALFECPWYELDHSCKKCIQMMIMRCGKPLTITIGPFGFMTLDAAISRVKLAFSLISVLSTSTI
ncbi:odorant receptor Or2-like [Anthonomus grandis grandis]|uniref:odorant receptor Or2-like n=1 Tax=Anthonomus grandis grandis TaxID=2921223 RepID=UPI00216639BD|nr:odorant receptor Or2-like [Anthonomus grandis grandis]